MDGTKEERRRGEQWAVRACVCKCLFASSCWLFSSLLGGTGVGCVVVGQQVTTTDDDKHQQQQYFKPKKTTTDDNAFRIYHLVLLSL